MSTIKIILDQLESSEKPVLKPLHKNKGFNAIVIGMKKGMILASHKAKWPSKLTVLEGSVTYSENDKNYPLSQYEEKEIQPDILHELTAKKFSICILTQSKPD